jgi:hypothetical protein
VTVGRRAYDRPHPDAAAGTRSIFDIDLLSQYPGKRH